MILIIEEPILLQEWTNKWVKITNMLPRSELILIGLQVNLQLGWFVWTISGLPAALVHGRFFNGTFMAWTSHKSVNHLIWEWIYPIYHHFSPCITGICLSVHSSLMLLWMKSSECCSAERRHAMVEATRYCSIILHVYIIDSTIKVSNVQGMLLLLLLLLLLLFCLALHCTV